MFRKLIPYLIILLLSTLLSISAVRAESGFTDVNESSWYAKYVDELVSMGIIDGFPDGTFRPEETLCADEFIKMTVAALGFDQENGTNYWASPYIEYAEQKGLLEYSDIKDFKKPLPRGEIVCIISKALEILGENIEIEACGLYDLYGYTPESYVPHVLKTYNAGIITGYLNNTFRYEKYINRAEACAVINKLVTPITRRERQITSLTPVPVCYSYIKEEIITAINSYEGNKGCFVADENILFNGKPIQKSFNESICLDVLKSMKLLYDHISYPVFKIIPLVQNNVINLDCFQSEKYSENSSFSMFSIKFYDAPTGYPEHKWGYDTMFMKLELNRLSNDGLLNDETGMPDTYYEYKIRSLMRLLFGIGKGDVFSDFILDKYIDYAGFSAGEIPRDNELVSYYGTKLVFFCEGDGRQLCFTFSED